jgi:hypothetical protein
MAYTKIYDSQLSNRNNLSLLQFLDRKQKSLSADNVSVYSTDMEKTQDKPDRLCPNFSFSFSTYEINEHVEYNVVLVEKYKILGRTIINNYPFKTRYSML